MNKQVWMRGVALAVSGAMFLNCGGAGLFSAVTTIATLVQGNQLPPPFTQEPTQPWYGPDPGRYERTRGGHYSETALRAIEQAAQKWRGRGAQNSHGGGGEAYEWAGIVAGNSPVLTGGIIGGGAGLPGEGKSGNGIGGGGSVNTANGNLMKPYTLVSWPSQGDLNFAFTLYHNTLSDYNLEFGANWTFTYGAKLNLTASQNQSGGDPVEYDVTVIWGDGSVVFYQNDGNNNFTVPEGTFDQLELLSGGNYLVTTPDLMEFEFTPPNSSITSDMGDLVTITDRNGNQITVTIEVRNGKEVVTKVEDCVTSRYVTLAYGTDSRADSMTDHTSRSWAFVYDGDDLEEIDYPVLGTTTFTRYFAYTGTINPVSRWISTETDLNGEEWDFTYSNGKVLTATNPENETTTYNYYTTYTEIVHPDTKKAEHHYSGGLLSMEKDENAFNVQYKDYNNDRLVTLLQDKRGNYWEFTYKRQRQY